MIKEMQIREPEIVRLIEQIGAHYKDNISNRFIRPALLQLPLEKQSWDFIEILTEKIEQYRYQGFHLDELYRQIAAAARFVALARKELVPTLRNRLGSGNTASSEKVLRDMAVNNFASNLQLFADLVNELFIKLVELDKKDSKGHRPLYSQLPELQGIGHMLVG
ncbi:MAG: hypothetical protein LBK40_09240 [Spirochaetaceae bacterium]|jgi:hypothetical protein|nr:hypothetical protein [Spirochaetaceae bacterium]